MLWPYCGGGIRNRKAQKVFDLIGEGVVKSIISNLCGGQKIKLEFEPPEGEMIIHKIAPDGKNTTYKITFKQLKEMMNK